MKEDEENKNEEEGAATEDTGEIENAEEITEAGQDLEAPKDSNGMETNELSKEDNDAVIMEKGEVNEEGTENSKSSEGLFFLDFQLD